MEQRHVVVLETKMAHENPGKAYLKKLSKSKLSIWCSCAIFEIVNRQGFELKMRRKGKQPGSVAELAQHSQGIRTSAGSHAFPYNLDYLHHQGGPLLQLGHGGVRHELTLPIRERAEISFWRA
jgi:hypothetical protein